MTGVSQATLYRYKNKNKQCEKKADQEIVAKIQMYLNVQNNNKFVRGKTKVRDDIEWRLKTHYKLECLSRNDYVFYVSYTTIDGLKEEVYDIIREMDNEADMRNCNIEADVSCDELDLVW